MLIVLNKFLSSEPSLALENLLSSFAIPFRFVKMPTNSVYVLKGELSNQQERIVQAFDIVERIVNIKTSYQLSSKQWRKETAAFNVKGALIGGDDLVMIAGPCAVESEDQLMTIAAHMQQKGIKFLRGGAFKPRTSPYNFQGLEEEGLKLLKKAADKYDLRIVTELMDLSHLELVYPYADIIQIGTRNMYNYALLKELGKLDKPVMLKRGMSARIEEWLLAAEYILLGGNDQVILCERGIRSFDQSTRNTLDIPAISLVKSLSHLPIIADPSQGTGSADLITPTSMAAIAAGADGLMIEVHEHPEVALSDGDQSLNFIQFQELLTGVNKIAKALDKKFDFESKSINFTTSK